jgi:long-subunit acyl-CoA synthetase (AMP-forming)
MGFRPILWFKGKACTLHPQRQVTRATIMTHNAEKQQQTHSGAQMAEFKTAHQALAEWAERNPDRPFLHQPVNARVDTYTWSQCDDISRRLAAAFTSLGLTRGDKIALLSQNCAEWFLADIAISMAGMISVPIYPTAGRETIAHVVAHSDAKAIIIGKLADPQAPAGAIPDGIITIAMPYENMGCDHEWKSLIESNEPLQNLYSPDPNDVMTILYTSGSTGKPKGVVITYRAYHYASNGTIKVSGVTANDRLISYLPLAHITERTCTAGPAIYTGCECFFVESLATFQRDLHNARATMFISVPRLWVKFQSAVHAKISPRKLSFMLRIPFLGKMVARKLRAQLGFAHAHRFGSGSAPISPLTLKWYQKIGVNIGEGWGMSETCGLSCGNTPFKSDRVGTIGKPVKGTEIRLSDDGEILIRTPGLFTEYYKQPELTKESFTDDGFFHTGDKGEWLENIQAYRITGRVKDQFKSAKGKYVVPVPIEAKMSGNLMIEQICVMGSGLPAPVAVVGLSESGKSATNDHVVKSLTQTLRSVNQELESHEKLARVIIVNDEWTVENELLTPTLKIKRDLVEARYQQLISKEHSGKVQCL